MNLSGEGKYRLVGSSLAHCFGQIGAVDDVPDVEDFAIVARGFNAVQSLLTTRAIAAGHDVSDGGLVTAILEMAFAGNVGLDVTVEDAHNAGAVRVLFAEELGLVIQAADGREDDVVDAFRDANLTCERLGETTVDKQVRIVCGTDVVVEDSMTNLRDVWEATSFELEKLQANPKCVQQEKDSLALRKSPAYKLSLSPWAPQSILSASNKPKVAILREEGTNGDREMASAFIAAGFDAWDISMNDLMKMDNLDSFRGLVACGGFSFADTLDSAKGWQAKSFSTKK